MVHLVPAEGVGGLPEGETEEGSWLLQLWGGGGALALREHLFCDALRGVGVERGEVS